jgi:hypothetical protein
MATPPKRLTVKLFSIFLLFIDTLHVVPIKLNISLHRFEVITGRLNLALYYAHICNYFLPAVYGVGSATMVFLGFMEPSGIASKELHIFFAILGLGGFTTQIGLAKCKEDVCHFLNSFWTLFERLSHKYRPGSDGSSFVYFPHWEELLQLTIMSIMCCHPWILVLFYLYTPFNRVFPLWIARDTLYLSTHQLNLLLYSYVPIFLMFLYVYFITVTMAIAACILLWLQLLYWSESIADPHSTPLQNRNTRPSLTVNEAIQIYRCLQICLQHVMTGLRDFYAPFYVFSYYIGTVALNYTCVMQHGRLPLQMTSMYIQTSITALVLLTHAFPMVARVHTNSVNFTRAWKMHVTSQHLGMRYNLRRLKSCMTLRSYIGHTCYIERGTTYRMVLLMMDYSIEAILFGKRQ